MIACGDTCEARFAVGAEETLTARPALGWRFTAWQTALGRLCEKSLSCVVQIGPVSDVDVEFTENLDPQLYAVTTDQREGKRRFVVLVGVTHTAKAVLRVRREGGHRLLRLQEYVLRKGANTLALSVKNSLAPGRFRLQISVRDDLGGGRTYYRVRRLGK